MSAFQIASVIGYSIAIPAIIGLIRYREIDKTYQPFILYCILDVFNHSLSIILAYSRGNNALNSNVFVFIEAFLFILLFRNLGLFEKKRWLFSLLILSLALVWITDNIILHDIRVTNSLFRIFYSFVLIFLSIQQINIRIAAAKQNLLYDACFLVCCGIIIYYPYKATNEVFFLIRLNASVGFYTNIFYIMIFINLIANLIFSRAMLWIPKKPKFISLH